MANVIPFKAVRPTRDKIHLVASRAFYTYKKSVLEAKLESNPYSFIHIINPEFGEAEKSEPNSVERFTKVKATYDRFRAEGTFLQDESPRYYIYRQTGEMGTFTGLVAGASVQDYMDGKIKIHENTLSEREQTFKLYLDVCGFNAEPVLLTYPDHSGIREVLFKHAESRPEYEFTTTDLIKHELWLLPETENDKVQGFFEDVPAIYIADGHHRSASSALHGWEKMQKGEKGAHEHFLAFFIPESSLQIHPFHRMVTDLNGLSEHDFIMKLEQIGDLSSCEQAHLPSEKRSFGVYFNKRWYALNLKTQNELEDPVENLDAAQLSAHILDPILGIKDAKTSKRIDFMGGLEPIEKLEKLVDSGKFAVAFTLFSVSTTELKAVADAGLAMPPKSTWIEPKLRSGLTIYELS